MNNNETITAPEAEVKAKKNPKKVGLIIGGVWVAIIVAVVLVLNFVCFHEWQEATGAAPMTCSKCGKTEGEALNEDDFMRDLSKGLEDRWVESDDEDGIATTKEEWEACFNAEYNAVIKYEKATFKDETMRDLARKYVKCIIDAKECLPYYGSNQWSSKYEEAYETREQLLYKIDSVKPIPVSEESRTKYLQPMLTEGETLSVVTEMLNKIEFKKVEDDWGWRTYATVVENTASIEFSYFAFEIDLYDKDGVKLTTEYASVNNWKAGEKSRFSFYTDENFTEMKVARASWNY